MAPSPDGPDIDTALARARMLFSLLSAPAIRTQLGEVLAAAEGASTPSGPLTRLDWLGEDGAVDAARLREVVEAIGVMRSSEAILEVGPLEELPSREADRVAMSVRIVHRVFERMGGARSLTEPEVNAGIAMITDDVALVRRDGVDAGVLQRTADGAAYRLAPRAG